MRTFAPQRGLYPEQSRKHQDTAGALLLGELPLQAGRLVQPLQPQLVAEHNRGRGRNQHCQVNGDACHLTLYYACILNSMCTTEAKQQRPDAD